jgi:hypothetical protein
VFPATADPVDEAAHAPGEERLWNESWYFDFLDAGATFGGYVRIGLVPNLGVCWYWACVVGADRPLVAVVDHEVPLPASPSLEVRSDGLWADHNVEEPLARWSLGLEAHGVRLDDPADAYRGARGDPTPLGFDLEWETDGEVFRHPPGLDRYEVPCRVHGEVLLGDERIELDGVGQRDHSWGVRDWWSVGWCWSAIRMADGTRLHGVQATGGADGVGYVQGGGREPAMITDVEAAPVLGEEEIPTSVQLRIADHDLTVAPVAWAPVRLDSPEGRVARFPRGLVRVADRRGTTGAGWIEFGQPPA